MIPMGTNCAPLLADLFLYSYEAEFVQKLLRDVKAKITNSDQSRKSQVKYKNKSWAIVPFVIKLSSKFAVNVNVQ